MKNRRGARALLAGLWATGLVAVSALAGASSANISKSYKAVEIISNGSIVSLDVRRADYVAPANLTNAARLLGVVLASDDSLLAVNPDESGVQVATSGSVTTFVSTLNGDIRLGDAVAVSPFNGVGMKAGEGDRVIGLAQTDFNGNSEGASRQNVRDRSGRVKPVAVGYVRLNIAIGTNNPALTQNALQRVAQSVTGKSSIPTMRLVVSAIIILVALIAIVTLTYSSIYGSIMSVGRNPLAKYAIFRATGSIMMLVILIAAMAGLSVFLLLR